MEVMVPCVGCLMLCTGMHGTNIFGEQIEGHHGAVYVCIMKCLLGCIMQSVFRRMVHISDNNAHECLSVSGPIHT